MIAFWARRARRPLPAAAVVILATDLSSAFCTATQCPPILNGIVVYRDGAHIASDYARALAPRLGDYITAALERRPP